MQISSELSRLINPVSADQFLSKYWEAEPLIISRKDEHFYDQILSYNTIDHLFSEHVFRHSELRLIENEKVVPPSAYTLSRENTASIADDIIDKDRVLTHFAKGATIVFEALHQRHLPLASLCYSLECEIGHHCQANIYLTPPNAKGFCAHYDLHDVFVLQVSGTKRWRIYDQRVDLPDGSVYDGPFVTGGIEREITLQPGDLLYLPRGVVHDARSMVSSSLHITLGVLITTWRAFLGELLNSAAARQINLRRAVPLWHPSIKEQKPDLMTCLEHISLIDDLDVIKSLSVIFNKHKQRNVRMVQGRLSGLFAGQKISPDTTFKRIEGVFFLLNSSSEAVELGFFDKTLTFKQSVMPALSLILKDDTVSIRSLSNIIPVTDAMALLSTLLAEGFLARSNPWDGGS